ncbi:MAG: EAL domain-containing protein [Caldilineaceae bacterium]
MKDIFLCYAAEDLDRVHSIAKSLNSQGWTVFEDRPDVPSGSHFRETVTKNLETARCVVVIWSKHSAQAKHVIEEAEVAAATNRLVSIQIDDVPPPYGFREIQTGDLIDWVENANSPVLLTLSRQIAKQIAESGSKQANTARRESSASVGGNTIDGLVNRSLFYDRLNQVLLRGDRSSGLCGVLMLDLDNFKAINDRYGHDGGDRLLVEVAKRLRVSVRASDTVARLHGDEFAIILENLNSAFDAAGIAKQILGNVSAPLEFNDLPLTISTSIGIALYPNDGHEVETLLRAADLALYQAKKQGRNMFHYFTSDLEAEALRRLGFEQDLRHALGQDEFVLYYQPQITLATRRVIGAEALLRWNHNGRGLVLPSCFLSVLEEKRLISDVTEWVLRQACRQYKEWEDVGIAPNRVSVNVSASELRQKGFVTRIRKILQETEAKPASIEFEINAGLVFEDELIPEALDDLKDLGIVITLDRFASRYPVQTLRDFPVDSINIESTAVGRVATDSAQRAIIAKIIELGEELEIPVVAEGVENQQIAEELEDLGCRFVQGFHYCPPLPPEDINEWLRHMRDRDEAL